MGSTPPKLTVWYNTKCPVCDAGINWQKNRLLRAVKAGQIEFRDINLEPDALSAFGADIEDIRRRLYGLDAEGACSSVPTARSKSGGAHPAIDGSRSSWACR